MPNSSHLLSTSYATTSVSHPLASLHSLTHSHPNHSHLTDRANRNEDGLGGSTIWLERDVLGLPVKMRCFPKNDPGTVGFTIAYLFLAAFVGFIVLPVIETIEGLPLYPGRTVRKGWGLVLFVWAWMSLVSAWTRDPESLADSKQWIFVTRSSPVSREPGYWKAEKT